MCDVKVGTVDALDGQRHLNFVLTNTIVDLRKMIYHDTRYDE